MRLAIKKTLFYCVLETRGMRVDSTSVNLLLPSVVCLANVCYK